VEVAYRDGVHGNAILTFDGSVLELFAEGKSTSSARCHCRLLHIQVGGPNRKGYYELNVSTSPGGLGGFKAWVHGNDWPPVGELLNAVAAAGAG
jgi:hypothetical protein